VARSRHTQETRGTALSRLGELVPLDRAITWALQLGTVVEIDVAGTPAGLSWARRKLPPHAWLIPFDETRDVTQLIRDGEWLPPITPPKAGAKFEVQSLFTSHGEPKEMGRQCENVEACVLPKGWRHAKLDGDDTHATTYWHQRTEDNPPPPRRRVVFARRDGPAAYEVTGNPMYAWEALHARADRSVPAWVLEYLQAAASRLLALTSKPNKIPSSSAISEALGFKRPGRSGGGTALSDYSSGRRLARLVAAARVYMLVHDEGHKPDFAAEQVARKGGLHPSTVARHYREHGEILDGIERRLRSVVDRVGLAQTARAILEPSSRRYPAAE
jgi:hypothetical protein